MRHADQNEPDFAAFGEAICCGRLEGSKACEMSRFGYRLEGSADDARAGPWRARMCWSPGTVQMSSRAPAEALSEWLDACWLIRLR
jgi:hypothetical protein